MKKMSTNIEYDILVGEYAEYHFIKSFKKKYKKARDETFDTIKNMLSRIDRLILTTKAEKIHICETGYIAKCEFKIAWSNESAKSSWNRIIVYVDESNMKIDILLVYAKTDIKWNNETSRRSNEIKKNYKDITSLFSWL